MKRWGPAIRIDGSSLMRTDTVIQNDMFAYEADVYNVLDRVVAVGQSYKAGFYVLAEIAQSGHTLQISPFPSDIPDARVNSALVPGLPVAPVRSCSPVSRGAFVPIPCTERLPRANWSDTNLLFTPKTFRYNDSRLAFDPHGGPTGAGAWVPSVSTSPTIRPFDPGNQFFDPDDVLVHELTHAARALQGLIAAAPTGNAFQNTEELYAITVANVYLSERGKNNRLRGASGTQFQPQTDSAATFYTNSRDEIDMLCDEMRDLTDKLATIDCQFNPFKERKRIRAEEEARRVRFSTP
jgi:hypothetical protein